MMWVALIVTAGVAVYWYAQARRARAQRDDAQWALKRKVAAEVGPSGGQS